MSIKIDNVNFVTVHIKIDHLNINETDLGVLKFDIHGDDSLKKFTVISNLENENIESFDLNGGFEIVNKPQQTILHNFEFFYY